MVARCFILSLVILCLAGKSYTDDGYFWHVTDFHYDFSYHGDQLSCNGMNQTNPGQFGDYWCDSPWSLINASVHAMASDLRPDTDVDFIIWTGDTVLHGSDDVLSYSINAQILDNVTHVLKEVFPTKPVYAAFGNHDYYPTNQFPPHNNDLYNDTLTRWGDWINDVTQNRNFLKGAYYTVKTLQGPRIVSLNTNLYYTSNKVTKDMTDPADQLRWLSQVMAQAESANEKVILLAHIPPGIHTPNGVMWFYPHYNTALLDIVTNYSHVIAGMFFGHDHMDGFKVLPDKSGEPAISIFIAPSVTPWRYKIPAGTGPAHNPGVRLVKYDRMSGRPKDIFQYYLDLPAANKNNNATWRLEYQATRDYGISDLSPTSLSTLASKMQPENSVEFSNYWKWFTVSTEDSLMESCDYTCQASVVCGFKNFDWDGYNSCKSNMVNSAVRNEVAITFVALSCTCLILVLARSFY